MAKTILIRKTRVSCIGDMRERIDIHDRNMQAPVFGSSDLTEKFASTKTVWANIKTISGQTVFVVNVDIALSHEIIIRYDENVGSESWIEYRGNNLKIVTVEDLDERHEFLKLRCSSRGDKDLGAAQA